MLTTQIGRLKTHLGHYLARVRRGDTVVVCDRNTPIAKLVPFGDVDDGFVVHEPTRPPADLSAVPGIKPKRRVDVVRLLRESRDIR